MSGLRHTNLFLALVHLTATTALQTVWHGWLLIARTPSIADYVIPKPREVIKVIHQPSRPSTRHPIDNPVTLPFAFIHAAGISVCHLMTLSVRQQHVQMCISVSLIDSCRMSRGFAFPVTPRFAGPACIDSTFVN